MEGAGLDKAAGSIGSASAAVRVKEVSKWVTSVVVRMQAQMRIQKAAFTTRPAVRTALVVRAQAHSEKSLKQIAQRIVRSVQFQFFFA